MKYHYLLLIFTTLPNCAFGTDNLIDLNQTEEARNWFITNDSVMGGISSSKVQIKDRVLLFTGMLSLENNGGFASIYRPIEVGTIDSNQKIILNVLGDGRRYQFRLRTDIAGPIAYTATFQTTLQQWTRVELEKHDFKAVFRGRTVIDAPKLDFKNANRIGFMLADKRSGNFRLAIDNIERY
jgi:NADH dehydrogenase [ubiquinone] 1 alpha subcomplex assembly factor 1